MNIYIKNGLVVTEEIEGIDTVTEDPSGKFKSGEEYTIEKWEMYNLPFEAFLARERSEIDSKAEEFVNSLAPELIQNSRNLLSRSKFKKLGYTSIVIIKKRLNSH